jgi:hypothetical protein
MRMRVVLDIDIDLDVWRTKYGERTSADLEVGEYVYRLVAFSDRMTDCDAAVHAK